MHGCTDGNFKVDCLRHEWIDADRFIHGEHGARVDVLAHAWIDVCMDGNSDIGGYM